MILVFGRAGQVARELARLDPGALCLSRAAADLSAPGTCAEAIRSHRPAAVINAAAWTEVDRAEAEEAQARVINADAPAAMARACAALGIPLVHISTDYVFDGRGSVPFTPDHPPAPLNAYGRTKLAGEEGVRAAGSVHAILRTAWVFSAHGTNFVRTMLRLGAERDHLRVVADQVGGPTPARALAAACLQTVAALQADPAKTGTIHFCGAPETSWADFARAIIAEAGLPCRIEDIATADYPTEAQRPLNSRLDCSGLHALGLAQPDWRAGLRETITELKGTA